MGLTRLQISYYTKHPINATNIDDARYIAGIVYITGYIITNNTIIIVRGNRTKPPSIPPIPEYWEL